MLHVNHFENGEMSIAICTYAATYAHMHSLA